jgi:hypothetical protein
MPNAARFRIRFDRVYGALSALLFLSPAGSYAEVDDEHVSVRMGWGFRANIPRTSIKAVSRYEKRPISRGVHGFAGRWLVNGSGDGIVSLELEPRQRGFVMGVAVSIRQLLVSVDEPERFIAALQSAEADARA